MIGFVSDKNVEPGNGRIMCGSFRRCIFPICWKIDFPASIDFRIWQIFIMAQLVTLWAFYWFLIQWLPQ